MPDSRQEAAATAAMVMGVEGRPVRIEISLSPGTPGFHVSGVPGDGVRELRDRVRAAFLSSGLPWPLQKIVVTVVPAGMRRLPSELDLPIAVAILGASGRLSQADLEGVALVGELGLDGSVRPVAGVAPMVLSLGSASVVVPERCANEVEAMQRRPLVAQSLAQVATCLSGDSPWPKSQHVTPNTGHVPDLADAELHADRTSRRLLEVAAAGGHNLLLVGARPDTARLAVRMPGLLPDMAPRTAREATCAHSAAGTPSGSGRLVRPPFRAPSPEASTVALLGGGTSHMRPGEISLAHGGCLFLDDLDSFSTGFIDALRQPLDEGILRISRGRETVAFPARFLLVAGTSGCACGTAGPLCACTPDVSPRFSRHTFGSLASRFQLRSTVGRAPLADQLDRQRWETTAEVAARVAGARERAGRRGVECNARLGYRELTEVVSVTDEIGRVLDFHVRAGTLTSRGHDDVLRVARTVADLAESGRVTVDHVVEAVVLRIGDRWGFDVVAEHGSPATPADPGLRPELPTAEPPILDL